MPSRFKKLLRIDTPSHVEENKRQSFMDENSSSEGIVAIEYESTSAGPAPFTVLSAVPPKNKHASMPPTSLPQPIPKSMPKRSASLLAKAQSVTGRPASYTPGNRRVPERAASFGLDQHAHPAIRQRQSTTLPERTHMHGYTQHLRGTLAEDPYVQSPDLSIDGHSKKSSTSSGAWSVNTSLTSLSSSPHSIEHCIPAPLMVPRSMPTRTVDQDSISSRRSLRTTMPLSVRNLDLPDLPSSTRHQRTNTTASMPSQVVPTMTRNSYASPHNADGPKHFRARDDLQRDQEYQSRHHVHRFQPTNEDEIAPERHWVPRSELAALGAQPIGPGSVTRASKPDLGSHVEEYLDLVEIDPRTLPTQASNGRLTTYLAPSSRTGYATSRTASSSSTSSSASRTGTEDEDEIEEEEMRQLVSRPPRSSLRDPSRRNDGRSWTRGFAPNSQQEYSRERAPSYSNDYSQAIDYYSSGYKQDIPIKRGPGSLNSKGHRVRWETRPSLDEADEEGGFF